MVLIDFPYTVDDEPTEDWKVEQVLHWWLLRANSESEAEYDVIVDGLSKQLHEGKASLWEAHEQVTEIIKDVDMTADNNNNNDNNTENVENAQSNNNNNKHQPGSNKPTSAVAKATTASSSADNTTKSATTAENSSAIAGAAAVATIKARTTANKPPDTIHIDVVSGPNEGLFYDLQPRTRTYSWIGRSQGRKFKQKGISLPKDLECSTTHGRFEYTNTTNTGGGDGKDDGPKFYFVDVGSTNGTQIDGYECEPNVSYVLSTGMNILCGKTNLKVTLLSLD